MKIMKISCLVAVLGLFLVGFQAQRASAAVQLDNLTDSCGNKADCPHHKKGNCPSAEADCGCKHKPCDCADAKAKQGTAKAPKAFDKPPKVGTKATCPVMGDEFTVKADTTRSEYKGKYYVFCCPGCKKKFDADPTKYVGK